MAEDAKSVDNVDAKDAPKTDAAAAKAEAPKKSDDVKAAEPAAQDVNGVARLVHPGGATSATVGGFIYEADDKGVFRVPVAAVEDLQSHGFELAK